jgi:phenylacetate-CoA ligase
MAAAFVHRLIMQVAVPERFRLIKEVSADFGWSPDQIRAYQDRKVAETIRNCWQYVPFYRRHWAQAIRSPDEVQSVKELERLPVLTKDLWRANLDELTTTDPSVKSEVARTGGSTGRPTVYRMTRHDQEMAWAMMYICWQWAGFRPGDPFLVVGGESIGVGLGDKRTWKDQVMNRWITSGSNLTEARAREVAALPVFSRLRFIYGYPNAIREFGDLLGRIGAKMPSLRGIACTAEVMRPEVRRDIEAAFGVRVHDQWGLNDGGLFACEGPDRDGLHVFFHRGVLEIVDDAGHQIRALKTPGKALATTLCNPATPFVRYETGDDVHWYSFEPAPSGVAWPRIGPVDGRTGDVIYLPSGRRIAMPGLTLVMRWLDGLRQYQFIQTAADRVTARLDVEAGFSRTDAEVIEFLSQKIATEITWTIVRDQPERTQNGKILIIRNDWLRQQGLSRPSVAAPSAV